MYSVIMSWRSNGTTTDVIIIDSYNRSCSSIMDVMMNTACDDVICQHPSCWQSRYRPIKIHQTSNENTSRNNSQDVEEELPTQKIMNLLAEYGPDPRGRYESGVMDSHVTKSCSMIGRHDHNKVAVTSSQDMLRVWAPHATPISASLVQLRSSTGQFSTVSEPRHTRLSTVQVQEVFDLGDLHANYADTFATRPYYVWVPYAHTTKSESHVAASTSTKGVIPPPPQSHTIQMNSSAHLFIPDEVAACREKHNSRRRVLNRQSCWLRHSSTRSQIRHYVSPASHYTKPCDTIPSTSARPLTQVPYTVIHDAHLESSNRSIKNDAHFSWKHHAKPRNGKHAVTGHGPGVIQLLDLPRDVLVEILGHLSQSECSDEKQFGPALMKSLRKVTASKQREALIRNQILKQRKMTLRNLSEKAQDVSKFGKVHWQHIDKTLNVDTASLPLTAQDNATKISTKPLPPIVSSKPQSMSAIGLHSLESDVRGAKPFYYKKMDVNFTLGHITPPAPAPELFEAPDWLSAAQLSKPSRQLVENAIASATHGTPLQRQMTTDSTVSANPDTTAAELAVSSYTDAKGSSCVDQLPDQWLDSPMTTGQAPVNSVDVCPVTIPRNLSGVLRTIPENDSDHFPEEQSTIPPRSRRSVRFADTIPDAPTQSPEQKSGWNGHQDPRDDASSIRSGKLKMAMLTEPCVSPGPPPPSPEPKDGRIDPLKEGGDSEDEKYMSLLQAFLDSDSEINLSARPPSTLDDISRINTPVITPP